MAFKMVIEAGGERCDVCNVAQVGRPTLRLSTTGRSWQDRNFIWIHIDCFERRYKAVKKKASEVPKEPEVPKE